MAGLIRPGTGDRYRTFRSDTSRDRYGAGVVAGQGPGYGAADVLVLWRGHVLSCLLEVRLYPLATMDSLPVALENCYLSGTTHVVGLVPLP